jgi:hypothetical protein
LITQSLAKTFSVFDNASPARASKCALIPDRTRNAIAISVTGLRLPLRIIDTIIAADADLRLSQFSATGLLADTVLVAKGALIFIRTIIPANFIPLLWSLTAKPFAFALAIFNFTSGSRRAEACGAAPSGRWAFSRVLTAPTGIPGDIGGTVDEDTEEEGDAL